MRTHKKNYFGRRPRILTQHLGGDGYLRVRLFRDGKRKKIPVHQIVMRAFNGPPPSPAHEVRHLDGNPLNNMPSNLAWGTRKENAADRALHGRTCQGERHPRCNLSDDDVRVIRESPARTADLARYFGVSPTAIRLVRQNKVRRAI